MLSHLLALLFVFHNVQTYSQLAHPIQQAKAMGFQFHSKILDIDSIDVSYNMPPNSAKILLKVDENQQRVPSAQRSHP